MINTLELSLVMLSIIRGYFDGIASTRLMKLSCLA